jgi:hypothetical protein
MSASQYSIFDRLSIGGVGTDSLTLSIFGQDGILFPIGTTGQRPTGLSALQGVFRYNTTDNVPEWFNGTTWIRPATVGGSSESDPVFSASPAGTITSPNITNWNIAYNKYIVSGTFVAGTVTFTRNDATTFAVNGFSLPQVNSDWTASSGVAQILNKPTFATVATTGAYTDLSGRPTIPAAQIQSDWTQSNAVSLDFIKNKPTLATVATTGAYSDLSGRPSAYSLPIASNSVLGGIKIGTGLSIDGTGLVTTTGGSGTVTSVAASITGSTALSIAGSPVTTTGTLAFTWTGSSSQQVLGDGTLATKITNNNQLTNGNAFITNATGLISAGTNVTITGSGTSGSPYVINSASGGGAILNNTQIGVGNGSNLLSGSSTFVYDGIVLLMGFTTGNGTSSTTPKTIDMGESYSSGAGGNLKLKLFHSKTDTTPVTYGFGVSPSQIDYVITDNLGSHVFYTNGSARLTISNNGAVGIGFYNGTGTRLASFDTNGNFLRSSLDPSLVLTSLALTGDVTGTSSGASVSTTIAANAVTYAKFQQVAAGSLVGNATGGTATATGITLGSGLSFSGSSIISNPPLASTQVGFGNGSNILSGSANLIYASSVLQTGIGDITGQPAPQRLLAVQDTAVDGITLVAGARANQTALSAGSIQALEGYVKTSHTTGNVAVAIGTIGNGEQGGTGTIGDIRGVQAGIVVKASGNITNAFCFFAAPTNVTAGTSTITNSYGLYIASHTPGTGVITNRYNIYTSDTAGLNILNGPTKFPALGSPTTNKLVGMASSTGEIAQVTLGSTLSVSSNTVDVASPVLRAAISTSNATPTTIFTYTPVNSENGIIWFQLAAIDGSGQYVFLSQNVAYLKNSVGSAGISYTQDIMPLHNVGGLATATASISAGSGAITLKVTGVAATTIYWNVSYIITAAPYLS